MAKRVTSGKREREKLKEQKRKDKQRRKEERQSGGVSSFEDMIAYVDENGQLCDTPPDKPKEEIELSEISISVPKRVEEEPSPLTGCVDYFNASKGYGFVRDHESGEKYFFHISSAPEAIAEGDEVTFEIELGPRGKNAVRMSIIKKQ